MADRVIQRNDTAARWQSINPVLAQGELGIVIDGAKGYKIGDGVTAWNSLEYPANPTSVVQELGNSEAAVISQKTVTLNLIKREAAYNTSLLLSNNFIFKKGLVLNIEGVIMENPVGYFSTEAYFLIDNNILSTKIENCLVIPLLLLLEFVFMMSLKLL